MDTNINSFLNWSQDQLAQAGIFSSRLDSEIILSHTLKLSRIDLRIHSERVLNESEKKLGKINIERRQKREPVSQIIGHQEFWSLDFIVNGNVLTPRPETEILIETALNCISPFTSKILDLGTGSGIIPIVMAKEVPDCQFSALEIDPKTLSIAKENAVRHGVIDRINFFCADMRKEDWLGIYSMIVSNPPYIPSTDIYKLMPEVYNYEPIKALDGGFNGLDFYRDIIPMTRDRLEDNGYLILEIDHSQASQVVTIFDNLSCYKNVEVIQDYSGYDRVIKAQKGSPNG